MNTDMNHPIQNHYTTNPNIISGVISSQTDLTPIKPMTMMTDLNQAPIVTQSTPSITKDQVKDYLRQWIRIENEITTLSTEIKKRKLIHQQLSISLLDNMRKNAIDCFDITNGKIVYSKVKTRAPLNNGQIRTALTTYYKDDADKANNLTEFLLSSRIEKTRESIKMKIPKPKI
jgi:hypothetical protein